MEEHNPADLIEIHELERPHHDRSVCEAEIAELRARIAELEAAAHDHAEEEYEEVEEAAEA